MNGLLRNIEKILRNRRTRRKLQRTISLFAAVVVFITTYSLVIPAITMEKTPGAGSKNISTMIPATRTS